MRAAQGALTLGSGCCLRCSQRWTACRTRRVSAAGAAVQWCRASASLQHLLYGCLIATLLFDELLLPQLQVCCCWQPPTARLG
jgi:hypothetical protein